MYKATARVGVFNLQKQASLGGESFVGEFLFPGLMHAMPVQLKLYAWLLPLIIA